MQKIKLILLLSLLSLTSCGDSGSKFIGKWTLLTEENVKSELTITRDGLFYFKNMPMNIICPEGKSNFQNASGDWSINSNYGQRIDFAIRDIKSNPCNVSSLLINGFYEKIFFLDGTIVFFPNGPDDQNEKMDFSKEND